MPTLNQSLTPKTDKLDGFTPSNGAMIFCCNGTGDYIKREDYRKLEQELNEARGQLRIIDRLLNLADIPIGDEHENYDTKQRVEILTKIKSSCWGTIDKLREDYTTLHSQLAELQKDKERLDWLEEQAFTNREGLHELHFDYYSTLRQAIDASMKTKEGK